VGNIRLPFLLRLVQLGLKMMAAALIRFEGRYARLRRWRRNSAHYFSGFCGGAFIEQVFNGKFSEQFSLGPGYGCCGSTSYNPTVGWTKLTSIPMGAAGSTVPEPGSMTFMGTGVLSLIGLMRRKLKLS
jgi:hypothetical protein